MERKWAQYMLDTRGKEVTTRHEHKVDENASPLEWFTRTKKVLHILQIIGESVYKRRVNRMNIFTQNNKK